MYATQVLLQLIGSVALMLLGVHQVRTGADRAFGTRIRRLIAVSAGNRFSSFASGFGAAILLQSSTAVAFITAAFAGQNLIALPAAIAVMLGADVGTTVAAQILTFDIKWLWTAFVVLGVAEGQTVQLYEQLGASGSIRVEVTDPRLLRTDPQGGLHLEIAVSERIGPDGREQPFSLREEGVRWQIESLGLEVLGRFAKE